MKEMIKLFEARSEASEQISKNRSFEMLKTSDPQKKNDIHVLALLELRESNVWAAAAKTLRLQEEQDLARTEESRKRKARRDKNKRKKIVESVPHDMEGEDNNESEEDQNSRDAGDNGLETT